MLPPPLRQSQSEPDEVEACEPFLFRQIEIVKPRVIVGLGTFAVQSVLKVKTPISKLRGNWHEVRGIKMMPTFHPAYLLRNPSDKRLVWSDIQEVRENALDADSRTQMIASPRSLARTVALAALAVVLVGVAAASDTPVSNPDSTIDGRPWVELIKIDGSINPAVAHFIEDSIASAQMGGARALIVQLDTPGGLMSSTERIIKDLFAAPVPVIVYVCPTGASAASAGTFITQAASLAAMAPGANIGARRIRSQENGGDVKGDPAPRSKTAAMLARNTAEPARPLTRTGWRRLVRNSVMIGDREARSNRRWSRSSPSTFRTCSSRRMAAR